jgi:flagella basal body P-ring formation protein FlgA
MNRLSIIILTVFSLGLAQTAFAQTEDVLYVDEEDIVNAIRQEFSDRGVAESENIDVELFGGQTEFQIKGAKEKKILINRLKTDENQGRFSCTAEIFADRNSVASSDIQGKYFLISTVWVPAKNIAKGELVSEDKLVSKTIRQSKLKPFMVTDKEKLIGQEAKKSLKEGKIISEKDIGAKVLVKKNDVVFAVYRTDRMQITAKAVAQQDGAYGDRIELQNMKTHKNLTGIVQDAATVVVDQ